YRHARAGHRGALPPDHPHEGWPDRPRGDPAGRRAMNDLFGLSMTIIMFVLLGILAVSLSLVGWVVLRNRVMFQVGVRNSPRRRAQTTLIIIGLMLSTLIITAAFSVGDTAGYSISNKGDTRLTRAQ